MSSATITSASTSRVLHEGEGMLTALRQTCVKPSHKGASSIHTRMIVEVGVCVCVYVGFGVGVSEGMFEYILCVKIS